MLAQGVIVLRLDKTATDLDNVELIASYSSIQQLLQARFRIERPSGAYFHNRDRKRPTIVAYRKERAIFIFIGNSNTGLLARLFGELFGNLRISCRLTCINDVTRIRTENLLQGGLVKLLCCINERCCRFLDRSERFLLRCGSRRCLRSQRRLNSEQHQKQNCESVLHVCLHVIYLLPPPPPRMPPPPPPLLPPEKPPLLRDMLDDPRLLLDRAPPPLQPLELPPKPLLLLPEETLRLPTRSPPPADPLPRLELERLPAPAPPQPLAPPLERSPAPPRLPVVPARSPAPPRLPVVPARSPAPPRLPVVPARSPTPPARLVLPRFPP